MVEALLRDVEPKEDINLLFLTRESTVNSTVYAEVSLN